MEDKYTKIDDYLDGNLSDDERSQFEASLQQDKDLAAELALYQETKESLSAHLKEQHQDDALSQTFKEVEGQFFKRKKAVRGRVVPLFIRLAAAAVAIFTIGYFTYLFTSSTPPVYADYADHVKADFTLMSGDEPSLTDAEQAFNQANYQKAETLIAPILATEPERVYLTLYLGISQIENGKYAAAKATLESITDHPDYRNEAFWYLALNQLAQEQYAEAKTILGQINSGSSRYTLAQELIRQLP